MRESFLHYLWRTRRFDPRRLITTTFQPLEILDPGEHNTLSGPDFFNARVRIGDTLWAGNIEIHVRASEWNAHGHQHDSAYENVILHVVYLEDKAIYQASGERIPTLELRDRIPLKLMSNYTRLENEPHHIPCYSFFHKINPVLRHNWLDRLLVERLEQKSIDIEKALLHTNNDWETAFYHRLAHGFGIKINCEPFEMLARSLPLSILLRHKNNLFQLEALLFGQAGFLKKTLKDAYHQSLSKEYKHLAGKYNLKPLKVSTWKFLRLRPASFPTVRIAQFAALIHQSEHLFSKLLEASQVNELEQLFRIQVSEYWRHHYLFEREGAPCSKQPGRDMIELLLVNTLIPFLFFYGKSKQIEAIQEKALLFLEKLPPETNQLLDTWAKIGVKAGNASEAQSLIQLKTKYCDEKRCYECAIGSAFLGNS
jgi:hypothetical protein